MTTPKIETVYRQGARWYVDPATGESVPGVTSVNDSPKPFLVPWASKLAAEYAVNNQHLWRDLADVDPQSAIDLIKMTHKRYVREAADRGTLVHQICEDISKGAEPEVPEHVTGYVDSFRQFLDEYQPVYNEVEATVWSPEPLGYAGTFDASVTLPNHGGGRLLIDYKASSGVYDDYAMQLAAYFYAPFLLRDNGDKEPAPKHDAAAILWLAPHGYALHPVKKIDVAFEEFKRRHAQFKFHRGEGKGLVGSPVNEKPARKRR